MTPLIETVGISKLYPIQGGAFWGRKQTLIALSPLSFSLASGECLGIVGESGSGKTTLGKIVAGLIEPDTGELRLNGQKADSFNPRERAQFVQMIFQDPGTALNPKLSIETQILEALRLANPPGEQPENDLRGEAVRWMERVGLSASTLTAYPHQLSGGQKQRANIARAIATGAKVVVADEPVSSLDLSIQAQILQLLSELKTSLEISYLVISHDLTVVSMLCERMIVLKDGVLEEEGLTSKILSKPQRPYTKNLLDSVPVIMQ